MRRTKSLLRMLRLGMIQWRNWTTFLRVSRGVKSALPPTDAGVFSVRASLTNSVTGALLTANTSVNVSVYLLTPDLDPANVGKSILLVGGSSGADVIRFIKSRIADTITLNLDERETGVEKLTQDFTLISRIAVFAGTGDDSVSIAPVLEIPMHIEGGAGRDSLTGGKLGDTLLGGFGDDTLIGGDGADVLDGGRDNDTLRGGLGDDALISTDTGDDMLFGDGGNDTFHLAPRKVESHISADGGAGDARSTFQPALATASSPSSPALAEIT